VKPLLSDEHFSVDGTLIEAWASHKSFKPKLAKTDDDGSNFHGQLRKNDTHQSTTDPEAKLYRKADGREAKLSYLGHALMENRNGLAVGGMVTQADGTANGALRRPCSRNKPKAQSVSPSARTRPTILAITFAGKPENRLRQTENPTTNDRNGLGYRKFFSKLLV
jgi:hypothetical protein